MLETEISMAVPCQTVRPLSASNQFCLQASDRARHHPQTTTLLLRSQTLDHRTTATRVAMQEPWPICSPQLPPTCSHILSIPTLYYHTTLFHLPRNPFLILRGEMSPSPIFPWHTSIRPCQTHAVLLDTPLQMAWSFNKC